ncbi:2-acylglycerol O-acyltransferase 2-like protein [Leptotrombidium deliense]|uniref:Acyltransferase n=1 Tax=Leptotrombidium deliense TaxID=299467 RepID=A0A443S6Y8_9ACAR|nr:2-acylglycerol O-acyltransferase 2-like protein [Leptotrombidium deliense]
MRSVFVKLALLLITLNRSLQTLAVFYFGLEFLPLLIFYVVFLLYLLFTRYYFITLLYSIWYLYDVRACRKERKGGRMLRNLTLWNYVRDYFPISLVTTSDMDPNKNYIFAIHPYTIFNFGAVCNFVTEANDVSQMFPGFTTYLLTSKERFMFPIHREIIHSLGFRSSCDESIDYLLTKNGVGNIVVINVGDLNDVFDSMPGKVTLNIMQHKKFILMAMKTGTSLVPVLSFGENDVYSQCARDENCILRRIQRKITAITRTKFLLAYGRNFFQYLLGLIPLSEPIVTVVGKPLKVQKKEMPADEEINHILDEYLKSLMELFHEITEAYGLCGLDLVIK